MQSVLQPFDMPTVSNVKEKDICCKKQEGVKHSLNKLE